MLLPITLVFGVFVSSVYSHSAIACSKKVNGTCQGYSRYYHFNHLDLPLPSSTASAKFYASRDREYLIQPGIDKICPEMTIPEYTEAFPMAQAMPGENITIEHPPRGHSRQPSSNVWVYMYPKPDMYPSNKQLDPKEFQLVGEFAFDNCVGVEQEISWANCTGTFTIPKNVKNGVYTFWWRWNLNSIPYTDCFEININSNKSSVSNNSHSNNSYSHSHTYTHTHDFQSDHNHNH